MVSAKANVPHFMMNDVIKNKDPDEMYLRAKTEGIKFFQFYEWIVHDIEKDKFNFDTIMESDEFALQVNEASVKSK